MSGSQREFGRMMRGALLTPWFAVSVGIVVATSMTLAAPHPALTFPSTTSGHCAKAHCTSRPPMAKGRAPAIKQDTPLPAAELPARQRTTANVHPAVKVQYTLLPRRDNQFLAVILIEGRKSLGKWTLRFSLPGAQIEEIMWARWAREGGDAVLVSGSPLPWPRSGSNSARLVIMGTGTPSWPTGCSFDGGRCTFGQLTDEAGQHSGSPGDGGRHGARLWRGSWP